jgi:hypothetical protein
MAELRERWTRALEAASKAQVNRLASPLGRSHFMNQGGLFTRDYLIFGVKDTAAWKALTDANVSAIGADLKQWFDAFPKDPKTTEARTEQDLIWKILPRLDWPHYVTQQALSAKGRENIPDGLLFADADAKARADKRISFEKYEEGTCIVESKKWNRLLDRPGKSNDESEVPSSQMLRYLRRIEDLTSGRLRWGILTNGRLWRLYFHGAKSVAEDFCELDLAAILGIEGFADLATPLSEADRAHWLKVFILVFRRESFLRGTEGSSFHEISLEQGKFYEESVAKDLSVVVFTDVFPALAKAIAKHDPIAPKILGTEYLAQVKDGALILLYRLLFVLYAEDRNLLPIDDKRYDDYGLRHKVRNEIAGRIDRNDVFSESRGAYWSQTTGLFKGIAKGDRSIGLPPYNGGLFDEAETPILARVELPDDVFAKIIDQLCRVDRGGERRYINYRDLSVQQLGSIYERLLEYEVAIVDDELAIRLNPFARKGSGSYYTPDELVRLIIERTVGPLVKERMELFAASAEKLIGDKNRKQLEALDPASAILQLKVCDPAMGSGHFLVDLVDYLADAVIDATVAAREVVEDYTSPLMVRIAAIRAQIMEQATANKWAIKEDQLDDRLIVRRMVLKRVIYGVDKNPMAVELAKVALWLHTFTVGAPLSFLDHHLRCGDSLFGENVRGVMDRLAKRGALILHQPVQRARATTRGMEAIELNTDADIAGVKNSAVTFEGVQEATAPLSSFMSLLHAFQWLDPAEKEDRQAIDEWLDGNFGEPFEIAQGRLEPRGAKAEQINLLGEARPQQGDLMKGATGKAEVAQRFAKLLAEARTLVARERYHHWQIAFPGVWSDWESNEPTGGFDAVIGNPPWDRIKFQEVEWFAARKPAIAHADTQAKRKGLVEKLKKTGDALAVQYDAAAARAAAMLRMARDGGAFPLLSGGDVNIYSLFVERALALVKPNGLVGLLTPVGIATDLTSAEFFSSIAAKKRIGALLVFENKGGWLFKDVHHEDKPTAIVLAGVQRSFSEIDCGFFIKSWDEFSDPNRRFSYDATDFLRVNPNTGTAPLFRTRRDAELVALAYRNVPILVDRSQVPPKSIWPVKYVRMFDMTNDSGLFRTKAELEKLGAYPIGGNRWKKGAEVFVPLYEGKMIQMYNHRYSSVERSEANVSGQGQTIISAIEDLKNPDFLPLSYYWIDEAEVVKEGFYSWSLSFNDTCNVNNQRTVISAIVPRSGYNNKAPLLIPTTNDKTCLLMLCANMCASSFDFIARQKIQARNLNKFILEQLPVISPAAYTRSFGKKSAGEIVKAEVLALTYTAHDMEPFARDMGYDGAPFPWDEMDRLKRKAKLDALYFILYGITNRDDVSYIYSTFPIVEREEMATHGRYLSRDYCLMYMNALEAGDPDAEIQI